MDNCMIYLSGPTSLETSIELLRSHSVIAVNGSAKQLINYEIPIFAYVVCDGSFYENNKELFTKYSNYAKFVFISENVLKHARPEERQDLIDSCYVLEDFCKSRGGLGRKIRYLIKSIINKNIYIKCSVSKRKKTLAFSTDVSQGHFGSATVAFSALQIAISIGFSKILFSGLDLTGKCKRFYAEDNIQPTALPNDVEFIIDSFVFAMDKHHSHVFNLSKNTAIPYSVIPFADIKNSEKKRNNK